MKKILVLFLSMILCLCLCACRGNEAQSVDDFIANAPSITGVVTEVHDKYIVVQGEPNELYHLSEEYHVSLPAEYENPDTSYSVGDEVIVYHNGEIAESDPLQINTVYAITLKTPAAGNNVEVSGTELSDKTIELKISPNIDDTLITEENILTNTTQITVSVDSLKDDEEILLYLYNADDLDNPILYATLSAENKSVDFTNLTHSCAYRVGAELKNSSKIVTLKITD